MQTISTTDLAHRLRPVIARLARRMRQSAGGDLSPTQGAALNTIACHGPLTPSELAGREKIQRPTATRVLARLEEAGLIDDAKYALAYARSKLLGSGTSRRRIKQELARKGVIERVARKKIASMGDLEPLVLRRRLFAFLARRGYDPDEIIEVTRGIFAGG